MRDMHRRMTMLILIIMIVGLVPQASIAKATLTASGVLQTAPAAPRNGSLSILPGMKAGDLPAPQYRAGKPAPADLPALAVSVQISPLNIAVGERASYTITVANHSSVAATSVRVVLPTPDGAEMLPDQQAQSWELTRMMLR